MTGGRGAWRGALAAASLWIASSGPLCPGQPPYEITELGTLGGESSRARAINGSGAVVGESVTREGRLRAFLWTSGPGMRDLGTLGGTTSRAMDINDEGVVVGEAEQADGGTRAFRWMETEGMRALDLPEGAGDSYAASVGGDGVVAGAVEFGGGRKAVLWSNGTAAVIGGLGDGDSEAYGVNSRGAAVGRMQAPDATADIVRGFIYYSRATTSEVLTLAPPEAEGDVVAFAINDLGQVTGYSGAKPGKSQAMVYEPVRGVRLADTLNSSFSAGYGISDGGVIVGVTSSEDEEDDHAFVRVEDEMYDLNEMIDPVGDWVLLEARDVNESGMIVGYGLLEGRERAFLLTPSKTEKLSELPAVKLTLPLPDAAFEAPATAAVTAAASSESGIRRVVFEANGNVIASDETEPYSAMWTNAAAGTYVLTATAVDNAGRLRRSGRVRVKVAAPPEKGAEALGEPPER
jgi:probable HAF family extracellular repeat protein